MLGDAVCLVGRTPVADDDVAHHAFNDAANQRRESPGEPFLVVHGFDQNRQHR
jgi:hypothetical protein